MQDQRRGFLKKTLGASAVVATVGMSAIASDSAKFVGSNGVVKGKSKKKEILYTKTANWDAYYCAAV